MVEERKMVDVIDIQQKIVPMLLRIQGTLHSVNEQELSVGNKSSLTAPHSVAETGADRFHNQFEVGWEDI